MNDPNTPTLTPVANQGQTPPLAGGLDEDDPSPPPLAGGLDEGCCSPNGSGGLNDTGVTPGTYGDATHVGQFTVNAQGRVTQAANVSIAAGGSAPVYIVAPSQPSAGTFATIAAAIAAAVADGASATRPASIYCESGRYTEVFNLPGGIDLVGFGAELFNCQITRTGAGSRASITGFRVNGSNVAAGTMINCASGGNSFTYLQCLKFIITFASGVAVPVVDVTGVGHQCFMQACVGLVNTSDIAFKASANGAFLVIQGCWLANGVGTVARSGAAGGNATVQIVQSYLAGSAGNTVDMFAGSGSSLFVSQSYFENESGGTGVDIADCTAEITLSTFLIFDFGTNIAINGSAGANLIWGGLEFDTAIGGTNKVATTTIGAGAVHIVVDTITAV